MSYTCTKTCQFSTNITREHLLYHVSQNIPTKIKYANIDILPRREDFLNKSMVAALRKQIDRQLPIIFIPTSIVEKYSWNDKKFYIYLFGVLPCGSKTCVILDNIDIYVDIMVPTGVDSKDFEIAIRDQFTSKANNIPFTSIQIVQMFRLHEFQKQKRDYLRIFFSSLGNRSKAITYIINQSKLMKESGKDPYETASDDNGKNSYFLKVAREHRFACADWNIITRYQIMSPMTTTNCKYVVKVDVRDFKKLPAGRRKEYLAPTHEWSYAIEHDPTIVGMWDIETYRTEQNGLVPTPADMDFNIFMICSAYFHHFSDEPLLEVCICDQPATIHENIKIMIICDSESDVLMAHIEVLSRMAPDILGAFNGGNFDWPLVREKMKRLGLLKFLKGKLSSLPLTTEGKYADTEDSIYKYDFHKGSVKTEAGLNHDIDSIADFAGLLDTDVLPVFLKMYPRAEIRKSASLNFFLAKNGLNSKEDMPYKRMFRIYERAVKLSKMKLPCHCGPQQSSCVMCQETLKELDCISIPGPSLEATEYTDKLHDTLCCTCGKLPRSQRDMADVGYYCVIDCIRPQQLYVKRMIIPDKRELSTMSYVTLADSFRRADGMKVCNVIGAYCHKRGVAFSNQSSRKSKQEKDHYPGGWVFQPTRGLHSDGYVEASVVINGVRVLKRIKCRPITGLDFASLYPSLMMTYNLSPDMIVTARKEAERLIAEGYSLYYIKPFSYEKGEKKGVATNNKYTMEGWTVRHNGVFTAADKKIVESYVKYEHITIDGETFSYPAEAGPTSDQEFRIFSTKQTTRSTRRVSYEPQAGRDALVGERMGIFSYIVKKIFDKRVPIKREFVRLTKLKEEMEHNQQLGSSYKDLCFTLSKIESKQKALKILANTFYGKTGDYSAAIYSLLVAAGITRAGQENIKRVAEFVESKGFTLHYGDSVTGDTPILCKFADGTIKYRMINELGDIWQPYGDKEAAILPDVYAWTERGWTRIQRVIRHLTDKPIYRVLTHSGCVDVTADHSLLNENAERVRPVDVQVGTRLLHAALPPIDGVQYTHISGKFRIKTRSKIIAAELYRLFVTLGHEVIIELVSEGYCLKINEVHKYDDYTVIKKKCCLGSTRQYVYDLETENHHFAAGIGSMIVHNTDSIYISCPDQMFAECDKSYEIARDRLAAEFAGVPIVFEPAATDLPQVHHYKARRTTLRKQWWTEQVSITMNAMNNLKEQVSDYLLANNGTLFLNMAYEEVGYPTVLCGKKKYFLKPHVATINFDSAELFIRGIDIIKQGQAEISRQLGEEFIRAALSPANELDLMSLAEAQIRKFYTIELNPKLFVQNARYKPQKNNVPVKTFVKRMTEQWARFPPGSPEAALYKPPDAGDKFEFVVVKKDVRFTLQGCRIELKKGDQMEYLSVYLASQATDNPMVIDRDFYMKSGLQGIFARMISYHSSFQPPPNRYNIDDKEGYKSYDKHCVDLASKHIESICNNITGYDSGALRTQGRNYQKIYRRADKQIKRDIMDRYGSAVSLLYDIDVHKDDDSMGRTIWTLNQLRSIVESQVGDRSHIGKQYVSSIVAKNLSIFEIKSIYAGDRVGHIAKDRINTCNAQIKTVENLLISRGLCDKLWKIVAKYERGIINIIEDMRTKKTFDDIIINQDALDELNDLPQEDVVVLRDIYALLNEWICVARVRKDTAETQRAIQAECAKRAGLTPERPATDTRVACFAEAARAAVIPDFEPM